MAKVLVLSYLPIYPTDSGGRVRIRQLATHLAERHSVTLICPPLEQRPKEPFGFTVCEVGGRGTRRLVDPTAYAAALRLARREGADLLLLEYCWQGLQAWTVKLAQGLPVLLDAFDVATVRFRRAQHALWPLVSLYERAVLRTVDRVFAVSAADRAQLLRLGAAERRTSVVPNGVDTSRFRPDTAAGLRVREQLGIGTSERLLFFFGRLDYAPNIEAVRILSREIMPRLSPRYRLAVAGRGPLPELRSRYGTERIEFLGPVDHLPDCINAADAVVAPLVSGSGTRIKILESLACGRPTVATSLAAEGLDLAACGPALTIADDWDAFAATIERVAGLNRASPSDLFVSMYDWRCIVERIEL